MKCLRHALVFLLAKRLTGIRCRGLGPRRNSEMKKVVLSGLCRLVMVTSMTFAASLAHSQAAGFSTPATGQNTSAFPTPLTVQNAAAPNTPTKVPLGPQVLGVEVKDPKDT